MTDDLGLPSRRELPPEVLDNVLASVRAGMGKPVRRRWPIVAAAAAVVLVLAGALVASVVIRETDSGPAAPDSDFVLDLPKAKAGLDRCWAAVQARGKAASFPARADWVPLFTVDGDIHRSVGVVAAMAGDKPFFCETTETTVTVTDPNAAPAYAAGTKTGALLMSPNGTLAGVANPEWRRLDVTGQAGDVGFSRDAKVSRHGNLFVLQVQTEFSRTTYSAGPYNEDKGMGYQAPHFLPPAPMPAVSITDRPVIPAPDLSSSASVAFRECLAQSDEVLSDQDAYNGAAMLVDGDFRIVLARFGEKVAICQSVKGTSDKPSYVHLFRDFRSPDTPQPARSLMTESLADREKAGAAFRNPLAGVVSRDAAQISIEFPQGMGADAPVVDGTFVVWMPPSISPDPDATVPITVSDAAGKTIYQGALSLY